MKRELDCIVCPMSCHLYVDVNECGEVLCVTGNSCPRGDVHARQELTNPMRMVTTTIRIKDAIHPLIPVITSGNVPKSKIFDIMEACKVIEVKAPIQVGTCILANVANTGVDLLASRTMLKGNSYDKSRNTSCHQ